MKLIKTIKRKTWTTEYYKHPPMCVILFTRNDGLKLKAYIDMNDYNWVSELPIYPALTRGYYIMYSERDENGKLHNKYLHKTILSDPDKHTDHINMNSLDNRRKNLRLVTCSENLRNGSMHKSNKVGRKGLCLRRNKDGKILGYRASCMTNGGQREKLFPFSTHDGLPSKALQAANVWLDNMEKANGVTSSFKTNEEKLKV